MDGKKKNTVKWAIMITLVIVIGSVVGAMIYIYSAVSAFDKIYAEGVSVQQISLGSLTKEDAKAKLTKALNEALDKETLTLTKQDKACTVPLKQLEIGYDVDKVLEKAFQKGHEGNLLERYKVATKGLDKPSDFELTYAYELSKIEEGLKACQKVFLVPAKDAVIERKQRQFIITPEKAGEEMDTAQTAEKISKSLESSIKEPIEIITKVIEPKHTSEELQTIQTPISSFTTSYNNADQYRNENLKVASKKINALLKPEEVFSLAKHLEPITYEAGYRPSKVIVNGKIEDGIGGGVCQIASTLYNAVLLSNLEITSRRNHSLPVAYVPLGRDATYATDAIDFRFKNNSKYPVFIESYCEDNKVYVNIFGHESVKPTFDEIKFQSETVEVIPPPATKHEEDPTLLQGKEVQDVRPLYGKKVKLYKLYYNNGKLVNKEYIDQSYYRPRAEVIKVGTKPAVATPKHEEHKVAVAHVEDQNNDTTDLNNYTPGEDSGEDSLNPNN